MNLLREYIQGQFIVIPPPPELGIRISELEYIDKRRKNPVTDPKYSEVLDTGMSDIFDRILIGVGVSGYREKIVALKNEVRPAVRLHKDYFDEMRPNELAESLGTALDYDYLESAQTPSYPSGHTTQAFYVAHCLSDIFPDLRVPFFEVADMVAESRIDRGVHFPSDNEAGKQLAYYLYREKIG